LSVQELTPALMTGTGMPPGVGCKMTADAADENEKPAAKKPKKTRFRPNMRD
jgi:hypothetical protein